MTGELRKTHILSPATGLWDRVRKHNATEEHRHYYDDQTGTWKLNPAYNIFRDR